MTTDPSILMPPPVLAAASTLPEGGMVPLAIALIGGIALWLAGVKIVRSVFIAMGAAVGGFTGAVLIPLTGLPAFNLGPITLNPGFTGLIVGGIIGALVFIGMLRLVITFTAALAFAVAGMMGALVFLHVSSDASAPSESAAISQFDSDSVDQEPIIDFADEARRLAAERATDEYESIREGLPPDSAASGLLEDLDTEENREALRDAAERSKVFVKSVWDAISADYNQRPARDRLIILSSTMAGLGLGLLLGVTMPKRSSALVTSLFGSAVWLAAAAMLVRANASTAPGFLDQPPVVWAVIWGVVTVIGMAVQFGLIKRRGSRPEPEDEDE